MNGKGKNDGIIQSDFRKRKDDASLHYQFFPEDRITRVFLEDPLPCSKKMKNKESFRRKKMMTRRLLRNERTILRKEWKKWQRQLSKQSPKKSPNLPSALKNSRFTKITNPPNKTELNNSQAISNRSAVLMPVLKRPLGEMTVPELVKYKTDLNNYLKYVCDKSCSSNSNIPKANGKQEKSIKLRLPKSIKSFISLNVDKKGMNEKRSDWPRNDKSDEISYDDEMGEEMEMTSELIAKGFSLIKKNGSKESPSSVPNTKELSQLIRKLNNFERAYDNPRKFASSKSFQNKVVSLHAPPNIHHPRERLEPRIKACDFPFDVCSVNNKKKDGMPWYKDTIKNSKRILRKCNLIPPVITETENTNLTCDSKVWLKIEKLIDGKKAMDAFVDKVIEKLRKGAHKK